ESYGLGEAKGVTINVCKKNSDKRQDFRVKIGERFAIPQTNFTVKIAQFLPDFAMRGDKTYSRSREFNNPAAKLEVYDNKQRLKLTQWVFYDFPDYHQNEDTDFSFSLSGFDASQYTGLQVVKDQGVTIIWIGCGLLMIGIIMSLFVFHRQVWAVLKKNDKDTIVLIGGITNKNKLDFEQEFRSFIVV
ncbi:MAG: cytochrome c biogenesis protein ResB, partial [Candidatus Desantisbacteria bacterium]